MKSATMRALAGAAAAGRRLGAGVSYTHLDVYKRQDHRSPEEGPMPSGKPAFEDPAGDARQAGSSSDVFVQWPWPVGRREMPLRCRCLRFGLQDRSR
ncbi:hypothetical protein B1A87_007800 [Arthrobacter sp. KBS0703]|uniref:hypothetical protein n=1 Tax=Arthrobacter sp. KBS0703 TaxID=1955698 RepID=UPI001186A327|nr:hypothetical protein [Arthrobacter sp. KBS0703]TSE15816.1 hypothetical protein B1A87_007800 [Arthrobacter sp. KBS0703]